MNIHSPTTHTTHTNTQLKIHYINKELGTQPAKSLKHTHWRSVFFYKTASYFECQLNKNTLLQCVFLAILPAGKLDERKLIKSTSREYK